MKKAASSYMGKIVERIEKLLPCLSAERTTEQKEVAHVSVTKNMEIPQKKASLPTLSVRQKGKKRRIPFVVLTLVILFTGLSIVALVGQSTASAAGARSSSAALQDSASMPLAGTPTSDCIVTNTCNPDPENSGRNDKGQWILDATCETHFKTFSKQKDGQGALQAGDSSFCWSKKDLEWGARDITCVYNKKLKDQLATIKPDGSIAPLPSVGTPTSTTSSPKPDLSPSDLPYNQFTCEGNGFSDGNDPVKCYSSNTFGNDGKTLEGKDLKPGEPGIHAQIGGDDITCYNDACVDGKYDKDKCGTGIPYDRFACAPIGNGQSYYYNPTAYIPGAIRIKLRAQPEAAKRR